MSRKSELEDRYARQLAEAGIGGYVRQYRFCPPRRWTFDFAFLPPRCDGSESCRAHVPGVAVEIEGQPFTRPGTFRDLGAEAEKFATAALLGWVVLRVPAKWLARPRDTEGPSEAVTWTRALLDRKGEAGADGTSPASALVARPSGR